MLIIPAPISTRNQFGQLCNEHSLLGEAVEIGTHRGDFAHVFLATWKGRRLHCVDPWSIPAGYEDQAALLWHSKDRNKDFEFTKKLLAPYGDRANLIRDLSETAAAGFAINSIDFVYIDGNHEYEYVTQDVELWFPKIRTGGILAGHDFACPGEPKQGWARPIQRALYDVFPDGEFTVVVEENGLPWSWYLTKE